MKQTDTQAIANCQSELARHGIDLPLLKTDGGPVFCEPWQAQVFAMTLALHDQGLFGWSQWAQTLGHVIHQAQAAGDPDQGDTYYDHWLNALERVLTDNQLASSADLQVRQQAWRHAMARTPHGQPIELSADERQLPSA